MKTTLTPGGLSAASDSKPVAPQPAVVHQLLLPRPVLLLALVSIVLGLSLGLLPRELLSSGTSVPLSMAASLGVVIGGCAAGLLGLAVALGDRPGRRWRNSGSLLAVCVAGLQALLLAAQISGQLREGLANIPLELAPSALIATGLLAAGVVLLTARRHQRRLAFWLTTLALALALTDLVGGLLNLDLLFLTYGEWSMQTMNALALLPVGAGILLWSLRPHADTSLRPDRRIILSASWLMSGLLLVAGITSFAMIKADLDTGFQVDRTAALEARAALFDSWLKAAMREARMLSQRPELFQALQSTARRDPPTQLARLLGEIKPGTVRALALRDAQGRLVALAGHLESDPALRLALGETSSQLLWQQEAILETRLPLGRSELGPMELLVQTDLGDFNRLLHEVPDQRESRLNLCGASHEQVICLPALRGTEPRTFARDEIRRAPVMAATGLRGVHKLADDRGHPQMAALTQIGNTGLGLSLEIPTRVVYAPLRRYTVVAVPIMVLLVILATAILHYQVAPVVTRLFRSERMATSANAALISISEQLRSSQERLTLITDNIPALISYLDSDLVYRFANAYYFEVLGRHRDEIVGRPIREVVGEPMYQEIEPWLKQVLSGMPADYHVSRLVDDQLRHFHVCYFPDYGADGKVQGFYSLSHDVTERKTAADALADSEKRLRAITDNIPALISQVDMFERCVFANRRFHDYFDIPRQKASGLSMRELLGEENYRSVKDELDTALAGLPVTFERAFKVRGETRFISTSLMPQFDATGKVNGFLGLTQDLTARKAAELGRLRSEERLRTITDNMPALIAYLDANGRFQFVNRTWEDWLGQHNNHLIGYTAETVLDHTGADPLLPFIRMALKGERNEFETELALATGNRHVRGSFLPHVDEESQLLGVYGMIHDVTALKLVELKLSHLARFDSLTGLPNRTLLLERMSAAMNRARRMQTQPGDLPDQLGVLFLDLDRFKAINDSFGHAAGDAVLQQFALRLVACVRETDTVGRLAGDEFVILLESIRDDREAGQVADKIIARLQEPFIVDGRPIVMSTSIGVTVYRGGDANPEILLRRADSSLYEAKHLGRNRYRMSA